MKASKAIGLGAAVLAVAAILVFMFLSNGDEQVAGVALTSSPVTDIETLDGMNNSKGTDLFGYDGVLYTASCAEFGGYAHTDISTAPAGKALYANIYFIASPQGVEYRAVWSLDGGIIQEETRAITSDTNREAVSYVLDAENVRAGSYTFEVYYQDYPDKQLYSQTFQVE